MLTLFLQPGHSIFLETQDGPIEIKRGIGINGNRIGIKAPPTVYIERDNLTPEQQANYKAKFKQNPKDEKDEKALL